MTAELPSQSTGSARACLMQFVVCFVFMLLAPSLRADVTGTILGTVTDTTGAGVPSAAVSLHNSNTGFERKTVTDGSGNYELLAVPAAEGYSIDVEAGGFRRASQTGIKLLVNQQLRTDFQLQVGEMKETVTVQGEPVQVESNSTQLGDVIEDRKMTSLPLNGRSYLDLLGLQAGVVPVSNTLETEHHRVRRELRPFGP